jgi:hypothetical protein
VEKIPPRVQSFFLHILHYLFIPSHYQYSSYSGKSLITAVIGRLVLYHFWRKRVLFSYRKQFLHPLSFTSSAPPASPSSRKRCHSQLPAFWWMWLRKTMGTATKRERRERFEPPRNRVNSMGTDQAPSTLWRKAVFADSTALRGTLSNALS